MTSRHAISPSRLALVFGTLLLSATTAFAAAPAITGLSPARGSTAGGTVVTLTGSGFTTVTSVTFDGIAGTALTIVNDTTLRVTTPAHAAGAVSVTAINPDGSDTLVDGYGYGNVPTTLDESYNAAFNTTLQVFAPGVLSNDNDNGGGTLTAELVTAPSATHGTLTLNADGSFVFTPAAGFSGNATFVYRAVNAAGKGNRVTVTIAVAAATGPQPPSELRVIGVSGNNVTLGWTPSPFGTTPTGYIVEGGLTPGALDGTVATNSTASVFTFTAPTGAFYLRVRSIAGTAQSAPSNEVLVTVNLPLVPAAPENLLGLVNGSTLALAWRNSFASGTPSGVVLDVSGDLTTSLPLGLTDTFSFASVPAGTYTFALRATNGVGSSVASTPITLTFPGVCSGAPLPPTNFSATRVGNTITVAWNLPASGPAPTGFVLNVSGAFTGQFATTTRQMMGTVGAGSYTFTVVSTNACGSSSATAPVTVAVP